MRMVLAFQIRKSTLVPLLQPHRAVYWAVGDIRRSRDHRKLRETEKTANLKAIGVNNTGKPNEVMKKASRRIRR